MRHQFTIYRVTTDWITHERRAAKLPGFTRQGPRGYARLMMDADRFHVEAHDIYVHYEVRRADMAQPAYSTRG